jgi:hypothetical protein
VAVAPRNQSPPDDRRAGATPVGRLEVAAAVHRADFERERERCDRLVAEMLKPTADLMAAREAGAA